LCKRRAHVHNISALHLRGWIYSIAAWKLCVKRLAWRRSPGRDLTNVRLLRLSYDVHKVNA
jgi:hypothetical protein